MAKKVRKTNSKPIKNKKGTVKNPYTVEELEQLLENGQWTGGYVEEIAYAEGEGDSLDGDGDGYYGNDDEPNWDWEVDDFLYTDETEPKFSGSTYAKDNKKDCAYRCISNYIPINSIAVSDLYGEWLVNCKKQSRSKANNKIKKGMANGDKEDFLNYVLPKFNKNVTFVNEYHAVRDILFNAMNNNTVLNMVATIKIDNNYHDVICTGVNPDNTINYYDPQDPSNHTIFAIGQVGRLYEINSNY